MIQRIQSIWLLLAAVFSGLSFKFPFYSGNMAASDPAGFVKELTAASNILLLFLTALLVAGCFIAIFFFKNRRLQLQLTISLIVLSLINLVIYFTQIQKYVSGNLALTSVFSIAVPVLLLLAARGIRKDEKLIKSLDRLR